MFLQKRIDVDCTFRFLFTFSQNFSSDKNIHIFWKFSIFWLTTLKNVLEMDWNAFNCAFYGNCITKASKKSSPSQKGWDGTEIYKILATKLKIEAAIFFGRKKKYRPQFLKNQKSLLYKLLQIPFLTTCISGFFDLGQNKDGIFLRWIYGGGRSFKNYFDGRGNVHSRPLGL